MVVEDGQRDAQAVSSKIDLENGVRKWLHKNQRRKNKKRLQNSKIVVPASVHGVAAAAIGCAVFV